MATAAQQDKAEANPAADQHVGDPAPEEPARLLRLRVEAATMAAIAQMGLVSSITCKVNQTIAVAMKTLTAKRIPRS